MTLNIKPLQESLVQLIWESRLDAMSRMQRLSITALRIGHLIIRDFLEGQLTLRAMGLVYTTLLALVPLLAVSFSVLKGFGVHNQVEPILLNLLAPLGDKGIEITNRVIEFVDNIKAGVLGSVGLAMLIYTVVSLLQKIERSFNYTWRLSEHRPLAQRFSDYLSVVLIGPVLVFTALGLTASVSSIEIVQQVMDIEAIGLLAAFMGRLLPYVLIISAFTFIYIFVPNTKVKLASALVGGLVAGVLWETTGWVFAAVVVNSTKYTAIYSAFATLIIFMIWLYLSWLILLIGGSIAFYHQHPEHCNLQARTLRLSNRMKEKISLLIMALIGQHYYQQRPLWTLEALAKKLNVGVEACGRLINTLVHAGLLVRTANKPPAFLPGQALETLSLKDVVSVVRCAGETTYLTFESLPQIKAIDALYSEIDGAIEKTLEERTLRDLSLPETREK